MNNIEKRPRDYGELNDIQLLSSHHLSVVTCNTLRSWAQGALGRPHLLGAYLIGASSDESPSNAIVMQSLNAKTDVAKRRFPTME